MASYLPVVFSPEFALVLFLIALTPFIFTSLLFLVMPFLFLSLFKLKDSNHKSKFLYLYYGLCFGLLLFILISIILSQEILTMFGFDYEHYLEGILLAILLPIVLFLGTFSASLLSYCILLILLIAFLISFSLTYKLFEYYKGRSGRIISDKELLLYSIFLNPMVLFSILYLLSLILAFILILLK